MRKRIYKREKFIGASYQMVMRYGFENLTAKRLATYMQISTQPIYNQFKSFQELKDEVVYHLFHIAITSCENCYNTDQPLVCFPIKLIKYYCENPQIYYLSWKETTGNTKLMYQLYQTFFLKYLLFGQYFNDKAEKEKIEMFAKLAILMLGLIEKCQMDIHFSERDIEVVWKDMVKQYS